MCCERSILELDIIVSVVSIRGLRTKKAIYSAKGKVDKLQ